MKKVLLAFDGTNFSEGAFEFARKMNETERVYLTGIFLPQVDYANLWSYGSGSEGPSFIPLIEGRDTEVIQKNIARFEQKCKDHHIHYTLHKDVFDFAVPELLKQTRFADIAILGSQRFYETLGTDGPNEYLREALHSSECPVLVVPEKFDYPTVNILTYDGSESSVYAIKQFSYLFPEFRNHPTLLVTAGEKEIPAEQNIMELVSKHFPQLEIITLDINPKKYFATWASEKKGAILVSGSFHRSAFSEMLRKSFIADVIGLHELPVFTAHK